MQIGVILCASQFADFVLHWIRLLSQYYLADYNEQGQCRTATEVEPEILYTGHLQYKPWKRPKPSLFTNTFSKSMYHGCLVLKVKIRARKGV